MLTTGWLDLPPAGFCVAVIGCQKLRHGVVSELQTSHLLSRFETVISEDPVVVWGRFIFVIGKDTIGAT